MGTQSIRTPKPKTTRAPGGSKPASASRDEEILRAAYETFTDKGFHGATMLDVAHRARASKSTLYARFASKDALFAALVEWATRQGTETLDAIVRDETLDPLTALQRYAAQLLVLMLQPQKLALFRIALAEAGRSPEAGRIFSRFTRDHGFRLGRLLAARLVGQGLIEIDDPDEYGHSFIGLLQGELYMRALLGTIAPPGREDIEKHARRAMTRLVRAFAPSRQSSVKSLPRRQ
jgi:TetR/AcrR family transcriptional repressor of mexJK operon